MTKKRKRKTQAGETWRGTIKLQRELTGHGFKPKPGGMVLATSEDGSIYYVVEGKDVTPELLALFGNGELKVYHHARLINTKIDIRQRCPTFPTSW